MDSPLGRIYVQETIEDQEFTFYLETLTLGTTSTIEHWNTIVVSYNGKKLTSMINDKAKEVSYHQTTLLNYSSNVLLIGTHLQGEF